MSESIFDNSLILGYQEREDSLYLRSYAEMSADSRLCDYYRCLDVSIKLLAVQLMEHVPSDEREDEKTVQYLGSRLLNSVLGAIRLTLQGYYQTSAMLMRDCVEVGFLLEYFSYWPEEIMPWWRLDDDARWKKYKPGKLRRKLDERDGRIRSWRDEMYDLLCRVGTHVTPMGFKLIATEKLINAGCLAFSRLPFRAF